MIEFYYYTSPNVRKVLIALEEMELPYTIKWTDIRAGDQFLPEYIKINPNSRVPAIVDLDGPGGQPLPMFETAAILQYLAEKSGRFLPKDPAQRWTTLCWVAWQVANQGPMAGQATHFVQYAPAQGIDDEYARGRYFNEINRCYEVLERQLEGQDYIVGNEYTIADIATYPWTRVAGGHKTDIAGNFPNVAAWVKRIGERPATKVKISDPREEEVRTKKGGYSKEEFQRLFRP